MAHTYSSGNGFGFDGGAFGKSIQAGLVNSAVQATQTITGGLINTGIEGLTGKALGDTSTMSNFFGGLAGQGVNVALGGGFTLNVLNFDFGTATFTTQFRKAKAMLKPEKLQEAVKNQPGLSVR